MKNRFENYVKCKFPTFIVYSAFFSVDFPALHHVVCATTWSREPIFDTL